MYTHNQLFFKGYVYIIIYKKKFVTTGITLSDGLSSQYVLFKTHFTDKELFTILLIKQIIYGNSKEIISENMKENPPHMHTQLQENNVKNKLIKHWKK